MHMMNFELESLTAVIIYFKHVSIRRQGHKWTAKERRKDYEFLYLAIGDASSKAKTNQRDHKQNWKVLPILGKSITKEKI